MVRTTEYQEDPLGRNVSIRMFGGSFALTWAIVVFCTLGAELVPLTPGIPVALFALYMSAKGLLFLAAGCLTPLTFWRFNALGYSFLVVLGITATAECVQTLIAGHRASTLEIVAKLCLISLGFVIGLGIRYEGGLRLGRMRFRFKTWQRNKG